MRKKSIKKVIFGPKYKMKSGILLHECPALRLSKQLIFNIFFLVKALLGYSHNSASVCGSVDNCVLTIIFLPHSIPWN